MEPEEVKKHNVKRELLRCLAHLQKVGKQLCLADDHAALCSFYSDGCKTVQENLDAMRAGVEATEKIIAEEIEAVELVMETPSAEAPPTRGAFLETRLTPRQRDLERRGTVFPNTLPKTSNSPRKFKIPEIIPHTPYQPKKAKKHVNPKKSGRIAI